MYAREIQGSVHSFGVSGKLIRNALVMYDRETDTLWSQFLSQGVDGPLKGVKLDFVASLMIDWESWLAMHPDTRVLDKRGRFQSDVYNSYYAGGDAGIIGETFRDNRLPRKALVVGLDINGESKAFALSKLQETPLVHDVVGNTPVVIVYDGSSGVGVAFEAIVDGQPVEFEVEIASDGVRQFLVDPSSGEKWNAFTGEAVDDTSLNLRRIPSFYSFWFAWKDFHPNTEVF